MPAAVRLLAALLACVALVVPASAAHAQWTPPREVPTGEFGYMSTWPISGTPNVPPVFSIFECEIVCRTGIYARETPGGAFSSQSTPVDAHLSSVSGIHATRAFAVSPSGQISVAYARPLDPSAPGVAEFVARTDADGTWTGPVQIATADENATYTDDTLAATWRPGGVTSVAYTKTQPYQAYDYFGQLTTHETPNKLLVRDLPGTATQTLHDEAVDHEGVYITSVDTDANTSGRQAVAWSRVRFSPSYNDWLRKAYVAIREPGAATFGPAHVLEEPSAPGWNSNLVGVAVAENGDVAVATVESLTDVTVHTQPAGATSWQTSELTGQMVQDSLHFRDGRPALVIASADTESGWAARYLVANGSGGWVTQTLPTGRSGAGGYVHVGHSRRGDVVIGWNGYDLDADEPWGRVAYRTADAASFAPTHELPDQLNGVAISESGVATAVYTTAPPLGPARVWASDTGTPAPTALITSGPTGTVTGRSHMFTFASDAAAGADVRFECRLDSGPWVSCGAGDFRHTLTGVADGPHTFAVRARLADGDPGEEDTRSFTVDNRAPVTRFTSGPEGDTTLRTLTFAFTADEPGATFECSRDGGPFSACASPHTWADVPLGPHTFTVRATDPAGNRDNAGSARVINVIAPAPPEPGAEGEACSADGGPAFAKRARAAAAADCRPDAVSCPPPSLGTISAGNVVAIALDRSACFNKAKGGWVTAGGRVRLNGLDLSFPQGSKLSIEDAEYHTYVTGKAFLNLRSGLQVEIAALDWHGNGTSGEIKFAGRVGPFTPSKAVAVTLDDAAGGTSSLKFENLKLPGWLAPRHGKLGLAAAKAAAGVSGTLTLNASGDKGLYAAGALSIERAFALGVIEVKDIVVGVDTSNLALSGAATVVVPTGSKAGTIKLGKPLDLAGKVTIRPVVANGRMADMKFALELIARNIDKPLLPPHLWLDDIGGSADTGVEGEPFIAAHAAFGFGPKLPTGQDAMDRMFRLDGTTKLIWNGSGGFRIENTGSGTLVGVPISKGNLTWDLMAGETTFGGNLHVERDKLYSLDATMEPSVIGPDSFTLPGHGQLKVNTLFGEWRSDASFLVSQVGLIGCVGNNGGRYGMALQWAGGRFDKFAGNCDVGKWRQNPNYGQGRAAQAGEATFTLPAGLPVAVVAAHGAGTTPKVVVTDPAGGKVVAPVDGSPLQSAAATVIPAADEPVTYVVLHKPKAGTYTVTDQTGAPITAVKVADGLPQPKVTGKVSGKGARRQLRYTVKQIPGQVVRFVERGRGGERVLGVAKGARGTLRFTAPAVGGKRTVVAQVIQDGNPRMVVKVARYAAPKPPKLGRVGGLKLTRASGKLTAKWRKAKAAARYEIAVSLSDGRTLALTTTKPKLTVRGVAKATTGTVEVVAVAGDGRRAKATKAKLGKSKRR